MYSALGNPPQTICGVGGVWVDECRFAEDNKQLCYDAINNLIV